MIKKARNITANTKSRKTKTSVDAAKNMEALDVGLPQFSGAIHIELDFHK